MRYSLIFLAVTSLSYANLAKADNSNLNFFPLNPRVTLSGGYGNANSEGDLDGMIPLLGNAQGNVYTDIETQKGADKSWFGSIGLGGRQALNDNLLLGAYGFVDRTQTISPFGDTNNKWWAFNPGIEAMTPTWDARINGYFPVGPNERTVSGNFFGDQVGMSKYVTFQGHNQFDGLYDEVQGIGTGTDADVGYTFKSYNNIRVHGGGYYFSMPTTSNIQGGETGAEMPVNDYVSLAVDDSYDNIQKNSTMLSLKLTLGSIHKTEIGPVTERLLDPIHRHLGTLYTSSSLPSASKMTFSGRKGVFERGNIWFFSQNGGSDFNSSLGNSNCTAEHPCNGSSFNQTNVNTINGIASNANFYFNPGSYSLGSSNLDITSLYFQLNNGQSMYGRTLDYRLPASQSTGYPIFIGGIVPHGNNVLDSFEMWNNNYLTANAINIVNANNITMNNLFIGALNGQTGYAKPIFSTNSKNILLENSTVNAYAISANNITKDLFGYGIDNELGSVITVNHNTFNVTAVKGQLRNGADGVFNNGGSLTANNNTFNVIANNGQTSNEVYGIDNEKGSVTLTNNSFNIRALNALTNNRAYGLYNGSQAITTTANGNTFDITTAGGTSGTAYGINNQVGTMTANNNTFNVTASGAQTNSAYGISSFDETNINNNTFNVSSSGGTHNFTFGVTQSGPQFVSGSNNTFNLSAPAGSNITTGLNKISSGTNNKFNCFDSNGPTTCPP
jgi:hypothetical protein